MARAVRKSHDPLFKSLFGEPEHAAALVRHILPTHVLTHLDFAAMQPVRGSFVDDQLSERYTDLLFSLPSADGEILVYILIEHQSLDDVNMPLRVLEYLARIWVDYRRSTNCPTGMESSKKRRQRRLDWGCSRFGFGISCWSIPPAI